MQGKVSFSGEQRAKTVVPGFHSVKSMVERVVFDFASDVGSAKVTTPSRTSLKANAKER